MPGFPVLHHLPEFAQTHVITYWFAFFFFFSTGLLFKGSSGGLLLGRKVMTNLDSIFKSTDSTLPTKVHLVKAIVFPVVMYGHESWT